MKKKMYQVDKAFKYINNFSKNEKCQSIPICDNGENIVEITIAIPTFKRSQILIDTIESAVNQQEFDTCRFEVLIVDNDPTRDCLTEKLITTRYSTIKNVRYFKNSENIGLFGNWNRCFELARGKWVVLLHDDDFVHLNFLSQIAPILKEMPQIAILKPAMESWRDKGIPYVQSKEPKLDKRASFRRVKAVDYVFLGNYMGAPTGCVFNRDVIMSVGGFNIDLFPSADTMLMLYVAMNHEVLLYRKVLGVQRIGQNETLKEATLVKFMISRYSVICFLIQYYNLNWLLGTKYKNYCLSRFYESIRKDWLGSFSFDFSQLDSKARFISRSPVDQLIINSYKVIKKISDQFVRL